MSKIGVIVGSLRKESWNRKLALALMNLAPSSLQMNFINIGQLPFYNQDPEDAGHPHNEWITFRNEVKAVDGILFVTPEYNRSVPAALKNAIDVGSRPYGNSCWTGIPCAVISASPGAIGGFGANQHLRQSFVFLDMPCMQQPEAYISDVSHVFNNDGSIAKKETEDFLKTFMTTFAKWVKTNSSK